MSSPVEVILFYSNDCPYCVKFMNERFAHGGKMFKSRWDLTQHLLGDQFTFKEVDYTTASQADLAHMSNGGVPQVALVVAGNAIKRYSGCTDEVQQNVLPLLEGDKHQSQPLSGTNAQSIRRCPPNATMFSLSLVNILASVFSQTQ